MLKVPVGTEIRDEDNETLIADLDRAGQARAHRPRRQWRLRQHPFQVVDQPRPAPRQSRPGRRRDWLWLRLKLIADAGLVGLPNAGKSTFLATVSAARPKIADYPFTTLHPALGVVRIDGREFVLADIPGLIEGAHEGAGLGDRFLGHVERCSVLLHLVDGTAEDPVADYRTVREELAAYGGGLDEKPEVRRHLQGRRDCRRDASTSSSGRLKRAAGTTPLVVSVGERRRRRQGAAGARRRDRRGQRRRPTRSRPSRTTPWRP